MKLPPAVKILNQRLGVEIGMVAGLPIPRFAWCYAPDMPYLFYASDDRTLLKKSWAHILAPSGGEVGRRWVLAEWRQTRVADHCGYGTGIRLAPMRDAEYKPYLETALAPGRMPNAEITQFYIRTIGEQLANSAEQIGERSFHNLMADYAYGDMKRSEWDKMENRERSAALYDQHTGAFGNCIPGTAGGFMSFGGLDATYAGTEPAQATPMQNRPQARL